MASAQTQFDFSPGLADTSHLARRSDPQSSKQAAQRTTKFAGTHVERIYHALRQAKCPPTAHEIAGFIGLTNVQVCRRLPYMPGVRQAGEKTCTKCGHREQTWAWRAT